MLANKFLNLIYRRIHMKCFKFSRFFGTVFGALSLLSTATFGMEDDLLPPTPPSDLDKNSIHNSVKNPCEICKKKQRTCFLFEMNNYVSGKDVCGINCAFKYINNCKACFGDKKLEKLMFNEEDGKKVCVNCLENDLTKSAAILPCGHVAMCLDCYLEHYMHDLSHGEFENDQYAQKCPFCRQEDIDTKNGTLGSFYLIDSKRVENNSTAKLAHTHCVENSKKLSAIRDILRKNKAKIEFNIGAEHRFGNNNEAKIAACASQILKYFDENCSVDDIKKELTEQFSGSKELKLVFNVDENGTFRTVLLWRFDTK